MTSSTKHARKLMVQNGSLVDIFGQSFIIFEKYVKVFDLYFIATQLSPDEKVLHGASVWYQYIDNNDDGIPDNKDVYDTLVKNKATMFMFLDEAEKTKLLSSFDGDEAGIKIPQDLQAEETRPGSIDSGVFDASLEECLHVLTTAYSKQYPDEFGDKPGSSIANAMDIARGGRFMKIPDSYPAGAWYTYRDETCDYSCQINEYLYWGLTSILGAQIDRKKELENEWKLTSRAEVETNDPAIFRLLTNSSYKFPTKLPTIANYTMKFANTTESPQSTPSSTKSNKSPQSTASSTKSSEKSGSGLYSCSYAMCFVSLIITNTVIYFNRLLQ